MELQNPQKLCYDSVFRLASTDKSILLTTLQLIINYVRVTDDPGLVIKQLIEQICLNLEAADMILSREKAKDIFDLHEILHLFRFLIRKPI